MKINDSMQLEPWIAEGYELVDDLTWKITLKDGVCFSNGKPCDAEAVKNAWKIWLQCMSVRQEI